MSRLFAHLFRKPALQKWMHTVEKKKKTTGIIVIGDEILKGEVIDTNSHFLAKGLHKLGLNLNKISVIGDNVEDVCKEVKKFSEHYDYVITSGGIGCTHDDITFEAVGKAFDSPLVVHPELQQICSKFFNTTDPKHPGMKLAKVPSDAKLNYSQSEMKVKYPIISVHNVYIFPGIPQFLEHAFTAAGDQLFKSDNKFYTMYVFCNTTEDKLTQALNSVVKMYPKVQFGSYPSINNSIYKVKITVESNQANLTKEAHDKLILAIPQNFIVKKLV
ncbi:FAD synthase isoform X1 [Aethina tumida]|uniref:FAD synthase isoform X1 n=1 Tax=Aethina tumida TaxID=116153 RepID=UPI0021484EE7|nr:FAD synthase isoform X1 [Aethina tumida]